jgi:hypothetical protein
MKRTFHVCSYGGCGSKMLCTALKKYGIVHHIHTRNPPVKLTHVSGEYYTDRPIKESELQQHVVIYIYKNPIKSLFSRFVGNPGGRKNIQVKDPKLDLDDVVRDRVDHLGFGEFFHNYTTPVPERNYKIICVKYEDIFERQDELAQVLGVGDLKLVRKETPRTYKHEEVLQEIFKDLLQEMSRMDFITVV